MKRLLMTLLFFVAGAQLPALANSPYLRLSWNPALKADLQIAEGVIKPVEVKVINDQGVVMLTHRFEEFSSGKVSFDELESGSYQLVLAIADGGQVRVESFEFVEPTNGEVTSVTLKILPSGTFGERTANPANTAGNVISPFNPEH